MQKSIKCVGEVLAVLLIFSVFYHCMSSSNFSVFFRWVGCKLLFVFNCSLSWKPFYAITIYGSFVCLLFILLPGSKQMLKIKRLLGDECLNTELQMQHN